jgi:hypothetical protein
MSKLDQNVKGMCTECKTEHSTQWMANNIFAKSGNNPSCKYCGGPVAVVDLNRMTVDSLRTHLDRERGL